jgi:DNA mismatch endonuclease, patch repair protein
MTPEQRSRCMSRIRGKDTVPELLVRRGLWKRGFRFRKTTRLPGRPDVIFPTERLAVFVDGCFWHACPKHGVMPTNNGPFWRQKIGDNVRRDRRTTRRLKAKGWIVMRFWEHEVHNRMDVVLDRISAKLRARRASLRPPSGGLETVPPTGSRAAAV